MKVVEFMKLGYEAGIDIDDREVVWDACWDVIERQQAGERRPEIHYIGVDELDLSDEIRAKLTGVDTIVIEDM